MRLVALLTTGLCLLGNVARADNQELVRCQLDPAASPSMDCPVFLTQGKDYILRKTGDFGGGCVEMVNPQKAIFGSICEADAFSKGFEFRSGQTATFWVRARNSDAADEGPLGALLTDCRDSNTTQCRLTLSSQGDGNHSGQNDHDRWKSPSLRKGKAYTLTFSSRNYTEVDVRTSGGQTIIRGHVSGGSKVLNFKAPADAPIYVRTFKGGPYTLQLR